MNGVGTEISNVKSQLVRNHIVAILLNSVNETTSIRKRRSLWRTFPPATCLALGNSQILLGHGRERGEPPFRVI
jgi:hypothetical protein